MPKTEIMYMYTYFLLQLLSSEQPFNTTLISLHLWCTHIPYLFICFLVKYILLSTIIPSSFLWTLTTSHQMYKINCLHRPTDMLIYCWSLLKHLTVSKCCYFKMATNISKLLNRVKFSMFSISFIFLWNSMNF